MSILLVSKKFALPDDAERKEKVLKYMLIQKANETLVTLQDHHLISSKAVPFELLQYKFQLSVVKYHTLKRCYNMACPFETLPAHIVFAYMVNKVYKCSNLSAHILLPENIGHM